MAFRSGQNYTDDKNNVENIIRKSELVKYTECNKKYESKFAKYMFMNENKNTKEMSWLQTRVKILKFESKKYASWVEKKVLVEFRK